MTLPSKPDAMGLLLGALATLGLGALVVLLRWDGGDRAEAGSPAVRPAGAEQGASTDSPPASLLEASAVADAGTERTAVAVASEREEEDAAPRPRATPVGPFLRGRVVDVDGFSIPGAEIRISDAGKGSGGGGFNFQLRGPSEQDADATTERDGTFAAPRGKRREGEIEVELRARGFQVLHEVRVLETGEGDAQLGVFAPQRCVVLAGVVVDAEGNPVAGAAVRRTEEGAAGFFDSLMQLGFGDSQSGTIETDEEGRFELPHEAPGEYELRVRHDHFPEGRFEGTTPPAGQELLGLVLQLAPSASIEGVVRGFPPKKEHVVVAAQAADGSAPAKTPLGFASFSPQGGAGRGPTGEVGGGGEFAIHGLVPGKRYEVQAFQAEGFFQRTPCSDAQTVTAGSSGVELAWDAGARVVFVVRDAKTGGRLDEVVVRYRWRNAEIEEGMSKRSFTGGEVELDELRPSSLPGTLELLVSAPGYLDHREDGISVPEGERVDLGTVRLRKAPIVRVRVLDGASREPVKRARVWLRGTVDEDGEPVDLDAWLAQKTGASTGSTDEEGWCELPAKTTATATLLVRGKGFSRYERKGIVMPRQGTSEETVLLSAGGTVEILVVDADGLPVEGAIVRHRGPDESISSKKTNKKGTLRLKSLRPGEHAFNATRGSPPWEILFAAGDEGVEGAEESWTPVTVVDRRTSSIVLHVPSGASLRGTVRMRGLPVPHATITILRGEDSSPADEAMVRFAEQMGRFGSQQRATTNSRGGYHLAEVPTGLHRLRVTRSRGAMAHVVPVEIHAGENRIDVELPTTTIEGRVVDALGAPIEGATVRVAPARGGDGEEDELEELGAVTMLFGGGEKGGTTTLADGSFVIEGVPSGVPLVVEASGSGFVPGRSETLTGPTDGVERGVEIVLSAAGSIRVQILGEGSPLTLVSASFQGEADPRPAGKMTFVRGGEVVLGGLAPGTWRVSLAGEDDEGELVKVRVGEEAFVRLTP